MKRVDALLTYAQTPLKSPAALKYSTRPHKLILNPCTQLCPPLLPRPSIPTKIELNLEIPHNTQALKSCSVYEKACDLEKV